MARAGLGGGMGRLGGRGRYGASAAAGGGAALLAGEANGLGIDFSTANDALRVAVKTAGVAVESGLDSFFQNASTSPKQVADATGALSWSPHNMFLNSAVPVTQSLNTVIGQNYTVTVVGSGSLAGSAGASGTATAGSPATFTATGTFSTFTKTGTLTQMQLNRGAVPTAHLVTTGAARYGVAVDGANGMLYEPAATNLLLASVTLSTQSVTVTAVAHMLSFWGTGTITLSGVSTAGPLVGTGAGNRVTLAFTPTAGSLTLTVTGTVSNAQLETGAVATSAIPTYTITQTRTADNYSFLLSTIPALSSEYSIYGRFSAPVVSSTRHPYIFSDATTNEVIGFQSSTNVVLAITDGGVLQTNFVIGSHTANVPVSTAVRIKLNDVGYSVGGSAVSTDAGVTLPTLTKCNFGGIANGAALATFRLQKLVIVTDRGWDNATLITKSAA